MKVGIMGGTFNPIHLGHLILAENAYRQLNLDVVWFMPSGKPPHKKNSEILPNEDRVRMVEKAIASTPYFQLSLLEIERQGTTYTVDTLEYLHENYPEDSFVFIAGADSLYQLDSWREPARILKLCSFAAARRDSVVYSDIEAQAEAVRTKYAADVVLIDIPEIDISSSNIRERLLNGRSIHFLVPQAVEDDLYEHHAYVEDLDD
ncbi:MAG: nicotinate-nucleotide adenylyltransferase [Lachnospiraceae bacterium]|nr:nicotinate-nucleotide adenylyltransferase [Lachnospiraceae bacterium]